MKGNAQKPTSGNDPARAEGTPLSAGLDYRTIFNAASNGMAFTEFSSGRILDVNDAWIRATGIVREKAIGRAAFELGLWADLAEREACLAELERNGRLVGFEARLVMKSAELPHMLYAQFVEMGGKRCVLWEFRNITEQKRAEAELRDSRNMLQTILDTIPSAVVWKDRDSIYLGGNRRFLKDVGLKSSEEVVGKSDFDLPWEEGQADSFRDYDRRVMESGIPEYDIIEPYRRADGTQGWANTNKVPLRDTEGNVVGILGTYEDITERKRAEAALRESELKYRRLHESMTDAFGVCDMAGHILECNRAYQEMLGYTEAELRQLTYADFTPEKWHAFEASIVREQILPQGFSGVYEKEYRRKDGTVFPVELRVSLVRNDAGQPVAMAAIFRDITERKQAQVDQQLAVEVLHLLNRSGDLTALVEEVVRLIKRSTDFEAVGLRLREGDDFPYFVATGFPEDFVCAERYLCARDQAGEPVRDSEGNPVLECMCGNILCGRTNPALPFFTEGGSFWTNSTTHLLATTTEADRLARTRNRCNAEGYESVALIPLRSGNQSPVLIPLRSGDEIIGLLQLNDRRPGRFTPEFVRFLEGLADSIGIALKRGQATEQIKAQLDELQRWHEVMLGREDRVQELKREVNELCGRMGETARYPSQEADSAASEALGAKGVAIKSLERRSK